MTKTIRIGTGKYRGRNRTVLQRAVDDCAAAGGGTVVIPAGVYHLTNALHLRSGVNVVGDGRAVLRKVPSVSSPVADYLGYGHYEFTVTQPAKFAVGFGVHLTDRRAGEFYDTVATITGKRGHLCFIDRMLNHDYHPRDGARARTLFPLVAGYDVRDVTVRGLVLDGNPQERHPLNGCRGGGVFLLGCQRVRLERLEVQHYFGDAISFQQCADVWVTACELHDNRGAGLHPGSGSVRYVFHGNHVARNTGCGLFYCLRTKYSRCEANVIEVNGQAGISIGERDTHHWICDNTIHANDGPGIEFRNVLRQGGDEVVIADNRLQGNCRKRGRREIVVVPGLRGVTISGNLINGRAQLRRPVAHPVGPLAAPPDAARHLNIARLAP